MKKLQPLLDRLAIGISSICLVHCLALPIVAIIAPAIVPIPLSHSSLHLWILAVVLPTSLYALIIGYKYHYNVRVLALGLIGISTLISAVIITGDSHDELIDRVLTVLGSIIVAFAHLKNFKLRRASNIHSRNNRKEN